MFIRPGPRGLCKKLLSERTRAGAHRKNSLAQSRFKHPTRPLMDQNVKTISRLNHGFSKSNLTKKICTTAKRAMEVNHNVISGPVSKIVLIFCTGLVVCTKGREQL